MTIFQRGLKKDEKPADLDSFEVKKVVGKGSFGQVCKAQHKITGKIYAIKLIKDAFKSDYHARKTIREVTILR